MHHGTHRRRSAIAFRLAMEGTGLKITEQQLQLADALGRPAPISRETLLEWKSGQVAVPMEAVSAACWLAGLKEAVVMDLADREMAAADAAAAQSEAGGG